MAKRRQKNENEAKKVGSTATIRRGIVRRIFALYSSLMPNDRGSGDLCRGDGYGRLVLMLVKPYVVSLGMEGFLASVNFQKVSAPAASA